MQTNSPWNTDSEMSSSAVTVPAPVPNTLVTPEIRIASSRASSGAAGPGAAGASGSTLSATSATMVRAP
jgi:hypothetical protein